MKILILLFVNMAFLTSAQSSTKIEFLGGSTHYKVTKDSSSFEFEHKQRKQSLKINKCNQKILDSYWNSFEKKVRNFKGNSKSLASLSKDPMWIQYNQSKKWVSVLDSQYKSFSKFPRRAEIIFFESARKCKK